jgi:hypothetical protein
VRLEQRSRAVVLLARAQSGEGIVHEQSGNLSSSERSISALAGAATLVAASRAPLVWRGLFALAGLGLIARAAAGHCAVKSVLRGDATLGESVAAQWSRMRRGSARSASALPGSAQHARKSQAIDESVEESFPASDPPASRIPDEPPVNAAAKWQAAAAAGGGAEKVSPVREFGIHGERGT